MFIGCDKAIHCDIKCTENSCEPVNCVFSPPMEIPFEITKQQVENL